MEPSETARARSREMGGFDCEALLSRLLHEIGIMLEYASETGKTISAELAERIGELCGGEQGEESEAGTNISPGLREPITDLFGGEQRGGGETAPEAGA